MKGLWELLCFEDTSFQRHFTSSTSHFHDTSLPRHFISTTPHFYNISFQRPFTSVTLCYVGWYSQATKLAGTTSSCMFLLERVYLQTSSDNLNHFPLLTITILQPPTILSSQQLFITTILHHNNSSSQQFFYHNVFFKLYQPSIILFTTRLQHHHSLPLPLQLRLRRIPRCGHHSRLRPTSWSNLYHRHQASLLQEPQSLHPHQARRLPGLCLQPTEQKPCHSSRQTYHRSLLDASRHVSISLVGSPREGFYQWGWVYQNVSFSVEDEYSWGGEDTGILLSLLRVRYCVWMRANSCV